MLITSPEYNRPHKYVCAKCGKEFMEPAFTNVHYKKNGAQYYPYADANEPDDAFTLLGLVPLCDSCAREEHRTNRVSEHIVLF
jgi:hypothetical protein